MARKQPDLERTVTFTINGHSLQLTASEGVLQRLAALLLYAGREELLRDEELQRALEGPLVFGDLRDLRTAVIVRLKQIMEAENRLAVQELLRRYGAEKLSDLDDKALRRLWLELMVGEETNGTD